MPEKITKSEIKEILEKENILPSEVYSLDSLSGDPFVKGFIESATKETQGKLRGEAEQRRRGEEGLDKKGKEWEDEKKAKDDEIKKLKIDGAKRDAVGLFTTKVKERKLDKKQSAYIELKQKEFVPEDPEKVDKEVETFMDDTLKEYKTTAEIFGHKTDEPKTDEPKGGGEPGEGGSSEEDELIPD